MPSNPPVQRHARKKEEKKEPMKNSSFSSSMLSDEKEIVACRTVKHPRNTFCYVHILRRSMKLERGWSMPPLKPEPTMGGGRAHCTNLPK